MDQQTRTLGLGKTLYNSSAAVLSATKTGLEIELLLTERATRKKADGAWPEKVLLNLQKRIGENFIGIGENRDVAHPTQNEDYLNSRLPFYEHLQSLNLTKYSRHTNSDIEWVPHHLAHAYAALLMSPFEKAILVVMDGAGSNLNDFPAESPEILNFKPPEFNPSLRYLEESTVYLLDHGQLRCVRKNWQSFVKYKEAPEHWISEGLGALYEKTAEFIFNDKRASGKVMGLAAFGRPTPFLSPSQFLASLDWSKAFQGRTRREWEDSRYFSLYADLASSVQTYFEEKVSQRVREIQSEFPQYQNLILTGGCALNCTTNMRLQKEGLFAKIYVPPFPGDESIGLGTASYLYHVKQGQTWRSLPWENQHGYFGSPDSLPTAAQIQTVFGDFLCLHQSDIAAFAAQKIAAGEILGWFQGRSETGPRALGHRSVLARADLKGLKKRLNADIKMRESFRPFGCSVQFENAGRYFEVPEGFENPFMSFAVKTRAQALNLLREVTHVDGTSRMQTVRQSQNPLFHRLLDQLERITGCGVVLNTSLNVMGEPIAETIEDARRFFATTPVDAIVVGDFYIQRQVGSKA